MWNVQPASLAQSLGYVDLQWGVNSCSLVFFSQINASVTFYTNVYDTVVFHRIHTRWARRVLAAAQCGNCHTSGQSSTVTSVAPTRTTHINVATVIAIAGTSRLTTSIALAICSF